MKDKSLVLHDVSLRENVLLRNVYLWMVLGLAITAGVAFAASHSMAVMRYVVLNPMVTLVVFIAQLVMVMMLSGRVERMQTGTAIAVFLGYSALTGLTLSSIFFAYAMADISLAFISATAVFAGGAVYGTVTRRDLRGMGGYLMMGLFGLIIASVVNLFLRSSGFDFMISIIGVLLFTGLSAWDARRIADINNQFGPDMTNEELTKIGILGALELYLDFLNIFLYLLRIFGRSSDN